MLRVCNFIYSPIKGNGYKAYSDATPSMTDMLSRIITGSPKDNYEPFFRVIEGEAIYDIDPNAFVMVLTKLSTQKDEFGRAGLEYNHALIISSCTDEQKQYLKKQSSKIFETQYGRNIGDKIEALFEYARNDDPDNKASETFHKLFIHSDVVNTIVPLVPFHANRTNIVTKATDKPPAKILCKRNIISAALFCVEFICIIILGITTFRLAVRVKILEQDLTTTVNKCDLVKDELRRNVIVLNKSSAEVDALRQSISELDLLRQEVSVLKTASVENTSRITEIDALKREIDRLKSLSSAGPGLTGQFPLPASTPMQNQPSKPTSVTATGTKPPGPSTPAPLRTTP